jgi:hypothetical protein
MNRLIVRAAVAFAAILSLIGVIAVGWSPGPTSAQDDAMRGHALVGTWLVDSDLSSDTNLPENISFSSDGILVDVQGSEVILGVWEPTGPSTATATFTQYAADDNGDYAGGFTARVSIEISADGSSFTGQYNVELLNPDGSTSGQAGPGTVTAVRVSVEAPGTPVMTMEDLFGSFGGTPEATPAS